MRMKLHRLFGHYGRKKNGFTCAAKRTYRYVATPVLIWQTYFVSIACVGCPWWRWSSNQSVSKALVQQFGILLPCITTSFGRSGSKRSQRRNLNWTVNWTASRTRSAGIHYERHGETVTDLTWNLKSKRKLQMNDRKLSCLEIASQ